jgi:DNA-binding response OmpR family regulator
MNPIVPGRFNAASISAASGELELRLSDGGNWQLKARAEDEDEWRLLCTGHLDGSLFAPPPSEDQAPIKLGLLTVDLLARRAHVRGLVADLTTREFDLLAALASDPVRLFTKRELLAALWGHPEAGRSRTLESHASRLRCKLRRIGAEGFVVNHRDLGYKLWDAIPVEPPTPLRAA